MSGTTKLYIGEERKSGDSGVGVLQQPALPVTIPSSPEMISFGQYIQQVFTANAEHRMVSGIDAKLLAAMRACRSEYSAEDAAILKAAGMSADIFSPLTDVKRRAAHAQISEIFISPGDLPFVINPTPKTEVPESVARDAWEEILAGFMQAVMMTGQVPDAADVYKYAESRMDEVFRKEQEWANVRAKRMETKVHDQLVEGGWIKAFGSYCNYLCYYGTALIKGPIRRVVLHPEVKETKFGTYRYDLHPKEILAFEAVNPWDCYPSKGAVEVDEGDLCIRVRFAAKDLWQFTKEVKKNKDGDEGEWFADTISALLSRYPNGGVRVIGQPYDILRQQLENKGGDQRNEYFLEGIEFFGDVRGSILQSLGIENTQDGATIEFDSYYEVNAIEIDGYVIYCKIIDPCVGRPLSKGIFYEVADSWWGDCIADKLKTTQKIMNVSLRNLTMNMTMTSGPTFWVNDVSRLSNKSPDALKIEPWKVFTFNTGHMGQSGNPMGVMEIPDRIDQVLRTFAWAKTQADEDSGIPAYTYGTNVTGGAGRTASGLAMLTEAASRGMKTVINVTDRDVVRDMVKRIVRYNLVYDPDMSIKGDCEVNPAGVMGKILREQQIQKMGQILNFLMNPVIYEITGPKALVSVLRELFKTNGILNIDEIFPSPERLDELELLQQIQQLMQASSGFDGGEGGAMEGEEVPVEGGQTPQAISARRQIDDNPAAFASRGDPSMRPESQVAERRSVA